MIIPCPFFAVKRVKKGITAAQSGNPIGGSVPPPETGSLPKFRKDGLKTMEENKKPNPCIACSVKSCAHHANTSDYCCLEKIRVGAHEKNPTVTECTDCESFLLGAGNGENTNRSWNSGGETGAR